MDKFSSDFLLGAALWLLDYWEMHCGSDDDYLSLLPLEPDERLEYDIPFSEDLDHSRDVLVRTLTLLRDRDGACPPAPRSPWSAGRCCG